MNNIKLLPSLLIFAEVAKRQSFTEAAAYLNMSKSGVSQHVSRLEEQVGLQLLSRHTRGMSLTVAGEKLLSRSALLKDHVDLAFQELASAEKTPKGTFSLTAPHVLEKDVIIPALRQLCLEFPEIEPRIIITDEPLDLIEEKLDVAVYAGALHDSTYKAQRVGTLNGIFCASPGYIQQHGAPQTIQELYEHSWIKAQWQRSPLEVYKVATKKVVANISPKPFAVCNSLTCATEMATQDMGIVFFSEIANHRLIREGKLVHILKEFQGPSLTTYMIHPYQGQKPLHVSRFYQLVKHYFGQAKVR